MRERGARVLLGLYLLVVAVLAFTVVQSWIFSRAIRALRTWAGLSGMTSGQIVEPLANVVFFVPLALLACQAFPRVPKLTVLVSSVAASVGIELVQAGFLPDRTPSLLDVVMNAAGAALGVALARVLRPDR